MDCNGSATQGEVPMPSERSTGLVFAGVGLVAAYLLRATPWAMGVGLACAAAFAAVSLLRPAMLRALNVAWFRLSLLLNRIVSPVVMLVLFCVTIVPFGVVMQLCRDPLRRRRARNASTYWIARTPADSAGMSRQF
jgi:hypothetical protein